MFLSRSRILHRSVFWCVCCSRSKTIWGAVYTDGWTRFSSCINRKIPSFWIAFPFKKIKKKKNTSTHHYSKSAIRLTVINHLCISIKKKKELWDEQSNCEVFNNTLSKFVSFFFWSSLNKLLTRRKDHSGSASLADNKQSCNGVVLEPEPLRWRRVSSLHRRPDILLQDDDILTPSPSVCHTGTQTPPVRRDSSSEGAPSTRPRRGIKSSPLGGGTRAVARWPSCHCPRELQLLWLMTCDCLPSFHKLLRRMLQQPVSVSLLKEDLQLFTIFSLNLGYRLFIEPSVCHFIFLKAFFFFCLSSTHGQRELRHSCRKAYLKRKCLIMLSYIINKYLECFYHRLSFFFFVTLCDALQRPCLTAYLPSIHQGQE